MWVQCDLLELGPNAKISAEGGFDATGNFSHFVVVFYQSAL